MSAPYRVDLREHGIGVLLRNQAPSGAFVAGPAFSQYGYAWFRDGAFIAEALDLVGERGAAGRFHAWAAGVVLRSADGMARAMVDARLGRVPHPGDYLHCRYRADGTVGPADWPTFQLDGPGIWLWSLAHHVEHGGSVDADVLAAAGVVARYLAALREVPAHDAWEERPEHVHTSTRAAILAGLQAASRLGIRDVELDAATAELDRCLREAPLTKWLGADAVDASLLWTIAPYGLLGPDEQPAATLIDRVEHELVDVDGGVHRYRDDTYYGGGAWILLTATLARVRLRRAAPGDAELAGSAVRWIGAQATADGDLPEQVATRAFHPAEVGPWRERWGPSARPLLWSHAAHLALLTELDGHPES